MENERNEQVIFIKDLFFAALRKWRAIVIVALAFALLLGGWKYLAQQDTAVAPQNSTTAVQEATPLQKNIATLTKTVDAERTYLSESVLMSIDPYATATTVASYTVLAEPLAAYDSQISSYSHGIVAAYADLVLEQAFISQLAEEFDIPAQYISELIFIEREANPVDGFIRITVVHSDEAVTLQIMEKVSQRMEELIPQVQESVAEHQIACNVATATVVSQKVLTAQKNAYTSLQSHTDQLALMQAQNVPVAASGYAITADSPMKNTIIFAVIGGVLGAFLVMGYACVAHLISGKVYSARTLNAWTGVRVLNCLPQEEIKNPVDRWLLKLEGRELNAEYALSAANIKNYCPEGQLLVCGNTAHSEALLSALQSMGVDAKAFGNLTEDVEALQALPTASGVLLLATCGDTGYKSISKQAQMVEDQGKNLLGCILIGG